MEYHRYIDPEPIPTESIFFSRRLDDSLTGLNQKMYNSSLINEDIRQHHSILVAGGSSFNLSLFLRSVLVGLCYPIILHRCLEYLAELLLVRECRCVCSIMWGYLNMIYLMMITNLIMYPIYLYRYMTLITFLQPYIGLLIIVVTLSVLNARDIEEPDINNLYAYKIRTRMSDTTVGACIDDAKSLNEPNLSLQRRLALILSLVVSVLYSTLPLLIGEYDTALIMTTMVNFTQTTLIISTIGICLTLLSRRSYFAEYFMTILKSKNFHLENPENIKGWLSLRTILFSTGQRAIFDVVFSSTILTTLLMLSGLFINLFIKATPVDGYIMVDICLGCLFVLLSMYILVSSLQINRIFKDTSVLRAEIVYLDLVENRTECSKTLGDIITLIESLKSSIRLFGFNVTDNFVHLMLSICVSGIFSIFSKLI